MKKLFIVALIMLTITAFSQEQYYGCWKCIKKGAYNIILSEQNNNIVFQFGVKCKPRGFKIKNCYMENDLLVMDNSIKKYCCHIKNDTLYYSTLKNRKRYQTFVKNN